jgi:hypothetical protein
LNSRETLDVEEAVSYISTNRAVQDREECSVTSCPICLSDFENDDMSFELVCKHVYHTSCLAEWFRQSPACPCCRQPIVIVIPQRTALFQADQQQQFRVQHRLQQLRETNQRRLQAQRRLCARTAALRNERSSSSDDSSDSSSLTSSADAHVIESESEGGTTSDDDSSSDPSSDAASDNTDDLAEKYFFVCI